MFTGIIETVGKVVEVNNDRSNVHFTIESSISGALHIDQSVSHNGVCLTVVGVGADWHRVTAVAETLGRTNLNHWKPGGMVNLERCLPVGGRLDGHLVQGHVDTQATCISIEEKGGSWLITFRYEPGPMHMLVDKGSVCLDGISLTVVEPVGDQFSVAIIPYTWENTNLQQLTVGSKVNIEFDIIGKYIAKHLSTYAAAMKLP